MSPLMTFQQFAADARKEGYEDVLERQWTPATTLDIHTHPYAVKALMVEGEMWLTVGGDERHLKAGDSFSLDREVAHAERYGPEGAIFWVARRSG